MLEEWQPEKHLPLIHEWVRLRGMGPDAGDVSLLPSTGFVADEIAAGFLYLTDSRQAFMDAFVSDPRPTKEARGAAIGQIIEAIITLARSRGVRTLSGAISVPSLATHVAKYGFTMITNCYYVYGKV